MTTATLSPSLTTARLSGSGILRSEWIKLRSLRSTVWSYLIVIAMSLGLAALLASTMPDEALRLGDPAATALGSATGGLMFGQLVVAVLGVLVVSGEYSTGMIRSTLTAVPRRLPALWAKAVVLFVATFVVGAVSTVGSFLLASSILGGRGIEASLLDEGVLLALAGGSLYLALVAVFALGIGTMLRSSAGGIAAALGILLLLPVVLQLIPTEWAADLIPYTPSAAGMALSALPGDTIAGQPEVWQSGLALLAWVAASILGAALLLKRRDA
ncbi:MAG TPA: ABC transporter permease [Rhodoglobus sp.]|nr:ABC transporter permease [Rhodoglobus sp.]